MGASRNAHRHHIAANTASHCADDHACNVALTRHAPHMHRDRTTGTGWKKTINRWTARRSARGLNFGKCWRYIVRGAGSATATLGMVAQP